MGEQKSDISRVLTEWGRWSRSGGVQIGYPSTTPFYRLSKSGGWGTKAPLIDDDLAGRVDRAVAMLELRCRHRHEDLRFIALDGVYKKRKPIYQIAEKHRKDRRTISSALQAAESWVDSQIFSDEIIVALVDR